MPVPSYRSSGPKVPYAPVSMQNYPVEYFSGADISIFFDDNYIDEITDFQFQLIEKKVPVFGYASYTADRFITGTRLVTGSFTTNMRAGDYMHELLYKQIVDNVAMSNINLPIINLQALPQPDPSADPDGFAAWITQQKQQFWESITQTVSAGQVPDLSKQPYFLNNHGQGFSVLIAYGDIDINDMARNAGRTRTIDQVHVWSVGQSVGLDPENIKERWQFVASDINAANRSVQ